jgi:DNA mismatch repair ATPase MutL
VLNLSLPPDCYDINVTPDKRKVFMEHETLILAALKQVGIFTEIQQYLCLQWICPT